MDRKMISKRRMRVFQPACAAVDGNTLVVPLLDRFQPACAAVDK
ncbi:hypothetical protein CCP3SC1AL1_3880002 [Gammaproteobacteria bacterium]